MPSANAFANKVSGGILSGGSEANFLAKETLQPSVPSITGEYETGGKGTTVSITAWRGIPKIKKALAVTCWSYWSNGTKRKYVLRLGSVANSEKETPGPGWLSIALTKAEAEALTQKQLEELKFTAEQNAAASGRLDEVYLVVEYEEESGEKKTEAFAQQAALTSSFTGRKLAAAPFAQQTAPRSVLTDQKIAAGGFPQTTALTQGLSDQKIAQAPFAQVSALRPGFADQKIAQAGFSQSTAGAQSFSGRKRALAAFTQATAAVGGTAARKLATAAFAQVVGLGQAVAETTRRAASLIGQFAGRSQFAGEEVAGIKEAFSQALGLVQRFAGRKIATTPITQATAVTNTETAQKRATGAFAQQAAATNTARDQKIAQAVYSQQAATVATVKGRKTALASFVQATGVANGLAALTRRAGSFLSRIGLVNRFGEEGPPPEPTPVLYTYMASAPLYSSYSTSGPAVHGYTYTTSAPLHCSYTTSEAAVHGYAESSPITHGYGSES